MKSSGGRFCRLNGEAGESKGDGKTGLLPVSIQWRRRVLSHCLLLCRFRCRYVAKVSILPWDLHHGARHRDQATSYRRAWPLLFANARGTRKANRRRDRAVPLRASPLVHRGACLLRRIWTCPPVVGSGACARANIRSRLRVPNVRRGEALNCRTRRSLRAILAQDETAYLF